VTEVLLSHENEFANGKMSNDVFNCFSSFGVKITISLILLINILIYLHMLIHEILLSIGLHIGMEIG